MLARLAENLYWAGRYLERAEDTARMADVTYHTLLESPGDEVAPSWAQLLEVLHLREAYGDGPLDAAGVLEFLVLDRDNQGSVIVAVARARENARSVRELISTELWEVVNDLHLSLATRDLSRDLAEQPWELLALVRRTCLTVYGVASETMPRGDAWRFLALGRLLERAEMTCRLIDVRFGHLQEFGTSQRLATGPEVLATARRQAADPEARLPRGVERTDFHHWVAMLKSASCFEAYRRRYRSSMDPVDVVEFLLLAPDLPRSVLFALSSAQRQLDALSGGGGSRAARQLGRAAAELQYRDVAELFELDLHDFLADVQQRVATVADAVAEEFFRHATGGALHAVASS